MSTKKATKTPSKKATAAPEAQARGRSKSPKMMVTRSKTPAKVKRSPSPAAAPKPTTKKGKSPGPSKRGKSPAVKPASAKKKSPSPAPAKKPTPAKRATSAKRSTSKTPKKNVAEPVTEPVTEPEAPKDEPISLSLLDKYMLLMDEYPYLMNAITGSVLISASVVTAQFIASPAGEPFVVDTTDVAVMVTILITLITPFLMWWGATLDKLPTGSLPAPLIKVVYDQLLVSPLLTFGIVAFRMLLLRSVPPTEVPSAALSMLPNTVKSAWLFWIPARFVAIQFIPTKYHVMYGNLMSYFWNIILSLILRG